MLNGWLLVGGIYLLLVGAAHALGGELINFRHLRETSLPANEQIEFKVTWHVFTVDCLLSGVLFVALALPSLPELNRAIPLVVGITALRFGLYTLTWIGVALRTGLRSLLKAPQWALILGAAVLALLAVANHMPTPPPGPPLP